MAKQKQTEEKKEEVVAAEENLAILNTVLGKKIKHIIDLTTSRNALIQVVTHDEEYFINSLSETLDTIMAGVKEPKNFPEIFIWSLGHGMISMEQWTNSKGVAKAGNDMWKESQKLPTALKAIADLQNERPQIFIMKDMNQFMGQPIPRLIRDMYHNMVQLNKTIIITSNELTHSAGGSMKSGVEPTLDKYTSVVNFELPSYEEIDALLKSFLGKAADKYDKNTHKTSYSAEETQEIIRSLQGLTILEIVPALRHTFLTEKKLSAKVLLTQKKQIIMKSGILEYLENNISMDEVGGMDNIKKFVIDHRDSHTQEAKDFGVQPSRGILLIGIPGAGKSHISKLIGHSWAIPTLRLDVGKVMQSLVGSSEARMREVIATCEAVAPVCLFIDEIEKGLSGTHSSSHSDGGTMARVFGTLLTSMQEGMDGVFVIATANSIAQLPPELIRRFDEVYFVDLPVSEERKEIFKIHLNKRKRDLKGLDIDKLVAATKQFTGAEIEKIVKESIAYCFSHGRCNITTDIILNIAKATKPLAVVMKEGIDSIRDWANGRAVYASTLAEKEAKGLGAITTTSGKKLKAMEEEPMVVNKKEIEEETTQVEEKNDKMFTI